MKRRHKIFIYTVVGLMLFSALTLTILVFISPTTEEVPVKNDDQTSQGVADFSELKIEDLEEGDGQVLELGDTITVNYSLTLSDGTPVAGNNTFESGQPATFPLTIGGLIEGWTTGLPGMKVGGTRRLEVPSVMGYGPSGRPPAIPGNAGLIFVVELLEIQ